MGIMNFLKENQRKIIRFRKGNITLLEPNNEELEELKNFIQQESLKEDAKLGAIRYIINKFCINGDFINTLSDEEIEELFNNGNINIKCLFYEILNLIDEVGQLIRYEYIRERNFLHSVIDNVEADNDLNDIADKFNKMAKNRKLDISFEDLIDNGESIKNVVKQINKKKK